MNKCPKCGGPLGERPALSRRDNKTDICSDCGTREAIEDVEKLFSIKLNQKAVRKND